MAGASTSSLQEKILTLQAKFEEWTLLLPYAIREKLPREVLSTLASYILKDPTIYEIINSLMDIQHIAETELFNEREEIRKKQSVELQEIEAKFSSLKNYKVIIEELKERHADDLKNCDVNIVLKLDEYVTEQQFTLERAGVPLFKISNDPKDIRVQMHIVDFIVRSRTIML